MRVCSMSCSLLYCTVLYNLSSILYFNFIPWEVA
jgi:hypothetical protein